MKNDGLLYVLIVEDDKEDYLFLDHWWKEAKRLESDLDWVTSNAEAKQYLFQVGRISSYPINV